MAGRVDRWQHLASGAFRLDEASEKDAHAEAQRYLRSVLEVFDSGIDPVEDYEAYAVRRMAAALLSALERQPPFPREDRGM